MLNLVILASGKGSRLSPITSQIPKCLVNIGNKTALAQQLDYWSNYEFKSKIVAVNPEHYDLVCEYLKVNGYSDISVASVVGNSGSYDAIVQTQKQFPEILNNTIFNWCDIIPKSKICLDLLTKDTIYTNGDACRFHVAYNKVHEIGDGGNVIGLYYKHQLDTKLTSCEDLVETFEDFNSIAIDDMTDFGDKIKFYDAVGQIKGIERDFNEVIIDDYTVTKRPLTEFGKTINNVEASWYSSVDTLDIFPKILDNNPEDGSFTMERVFGTMAWENYHGLSTDQVLTTLRDLYNNNSSILVGPHQLQNDIKFEAYDKVLERCTEIEGMLKSFGPINKVNGELLPQQSLEDICNIGMDLILQENENTNEYNTIHGDPHFSNVIITADNKVKLIDPRGKFGLTNKFGLKSYDSAKVLYSVSGFDNFNASKDFNIDVINGDIMFDIIPLCENYLDMDQFTDEDRFWLPIIWISLAGYFKNNPVKSVAAYYHGLSLSKTIYGL